MTIQDNSTMSVRTVKQHRRFEGVVVSAKDKTLSVVVTTVKMHPKYSKQYVTTKKYPTHDEKSAAKVGDRVLIEACRPMSKTKRWRLLKVLGQA